MRLWSKLSLLLFVAAFFSTPVLAADVDKDKDKSDKTSGRTASAHASKVGDCNLGSATVDLSANNVRARLYNNGALFWKGSGNVYTVPKNGEANAIFASGIWVGGLVDGELRFAGTDYGPFEYWPGPLDANGQPPADCSQFDRIWSVTTDDVAAYEAGQPHSADLEEWPWQLGAPVVDGDGNPNNYNLAGGDRPEIIGAQTAWWVMNDAAGVKGWSQTAPIGLEVQVTAFAFRTADALNNTTFYKYKLIYKGQEPITDTYFGIWSDPDLGNAVDDFVGSDTLLGMAYVYNGDNFDDGVDGYQNRPPALGYDYFQGPLVDNDGRDNNGDGEVDEPGERIQMSKFVYYNNDSSAQGNPDGSTDDPYNYLRGIWRDGTVMTLGGTGYGGSEPVDFMFPGDPVSRSFWSEENVDGAGSRNTPADRRFLMSSGPFTMQPGDTQEIVYGIVWSQSVNRLASVAQLKFDDILAQGAFNSGFNIPAAPDMPQVIAEPLDQKVAITWNNPPSSNNYLGSYDQPSAFLIDQSPPDNNTTYTFEGYRIFQYEDALDQTGRVIATYDVKNNVTTIVDETIDLSSGAVVSQVVASGSDSGVQNFHVVENLTNYQEYHFGVQAYAFNPHSSPKVYASPVNRFTISPSKATARSGGTASIADPNTQIASNRLQGSGDAVGVFAEVANPAAVTGHEYTVNFYRAPLVRGSDTTMVLTYNIVDATAGEVKVDGEAFLRNRGQNLPFGEDVHLVDGLSFTIKTADPDFAGSGDGIVEVATEDGPLPPSEYDGAGAPYGGNKVWHSLNAAGHADRYYVGAGGGGGDLDRMKRYIDFAVPRDFEMRFTDEGGYGVFPFEDDKIARVPFELWDIGIATPDDPSDDRRMIPFLLSNAGTSDTWGWATGEDPYFGYPASDWVYWMDPEGENGYENFEAAAIAAGGAGATYPYDSDGSTDGYFADFHGGFVYPIGRMILADFDGNGEPPPSGTVIRLVTTKPLANGDVFSVATSDLAPVRNDAATAEAALESIGIVPNPYKGASNYEVSVSEDIVRFTNLPAQARVRVFSLAGTLVWEGVMGTTNNQWNLTTSEGLPLASGMYLVHVDVEGVGEKVIKFGVVKKRIQLDLL